MSIRGVTLLSILDVALLSLTSTWSEYGHPALLGQCRTEDPSTTPGAVLPRLSRVAPITHIATLVETFNVATLVVATLVENCNVAILVEATLVDRFFLTTAGPHSARALNLDMGVSKKEGHLN